MLFRESSGVVGVLDDECAHRHLPLSMGELVDDHVVCAYHGFTFASSGACVRVPSQRNVPYGARVRSYPVRDDGSFVWVWLGEVAASQGVEPPHLPWLAAPDWTALGGTTEVAANYLLLHDNALDRTHFPYVHPERIHTGYVVDPPPLQIQVTETSVSYTRTFAPAPLTEWQLAATGLSGETEYVQRESGEFVSPALHIDHMDIIGATPADGSEPAVFQALFVRAFTPVDPAHTLVFWRAVRNYALDDVAVGENLREVYEGTMTEDQPLLETIQANSAGRPRSSVHATADAAAIKAYQIVDALLDEERGRRNRVSRLRRRP